MNSVHILPLIMYRIYAEQVQGSIPAFKARPRKKKNENNGNQRVSLFHHY